jgi:hypothetical protein
MKIDQQTLNLLLLLKKKKTAAQEEQGISAFLLGSNL